MPTAEYARDEGHYRALPGPRGTYYAAYILSIATSGMNSSHSQHHNISREDLGGLFRPDESLPQVSKRH